MRAARSKLFSVGDFAWAASLLVISLFVVGCAAVNSTSKQVSPTPTLSLSATSFNFQTVVVGNSATQTFTLSNTGTSPVQITTLSVSGSEFSITGPSVPRTILPANSLSYTLTFTPTSAGSATATVNITSPNLSSPATLSLSGNGTSATTSHTVHLTWDASTSQVIGYRVYRSETSGGSYNPLFGTAINALTYDDTSVSSALTYYYVVTAVDAAGNESVQSNQATAVIPAS